jgi:iron complex transport system substrate-binding protein
MAERIATLLPSATEIVCALGLGDEIVGISHECDHPPEILGRTVLTEPKIDPRGSSAEIDGAVRRLARDGLSVYRIRERELCDVRPDLIVTQDQCEVCAVSLAEVREATGRLLGNAVEIVSLRPGNLDDICEDFRRVGAAAGRVELGRELAERTRARLERLRRGARHVRSRPRVACIEWLDPLMVAGNWIPELIELAGGAGELTAAGEHARTITWAELADYGPEVIVLMPCGFRLEQTRREIPSLSARPEWRALPAVRNRRVYSVDGNAYFNRPGPRIAESAEILAGLVQPGHFASLLPPGCYEHVGS